MSKTPINKFACYQCRKSMSFGFIIKLRMDQDGFCFSRLLSANCNMDTTFEAQLKHISQSIVATSELALFVYQLSSFYEAVMQNIVTVAHPANWYRALQAIRQENLRFVIALVISKILYGGQEMRYMPHITLALMLKSSWIRL